MASARDPRPLPNVAKARPPLSTRFLDAYKSESNEFVILYSMKYALIFVGLLGTCLLGVYLRFGSISPCGILFRIAYEDVRDDLTDPRPIYQRAYRFIDTCSPWECLERAVNFERTKCIFRRSDEIREGKRNIEDLGGC